MKSLTGVVHGMTIELSDNPGLPDGEMVEVHVHPLAGSTAVDVTSVRRLPGPPPGWYPGCAETAGGILADVWSDEDDRILAEIERQRELAVCRELPE